MNFQLSSQRKLNWEINEITRDEIEGKEQKVHWVNRRPMKNKKHTKSIFLIFVCFPIFLFPTLDPPVVIVKPDNLTINETGEFLLFCEYDANPASLASVRWLQNNSVLNLNQSRFDGGNPEQTALLVKNATRDDRGAYSCELTNQVGTGMSENGVVVDVQCESYKMNSWLLFWQTCFPFSLARDLVNRQTNRIDSLRANIAGRRRWACKRNASLRRTRRKSPQIT